MGVYEQLGVRTLINAHGTLTRIGGSLMSPFVVEAMREAGEAYVDLDQLIEKAGERIAKVVGVEGVLITAGSAAGMTIAAAGCMAGSDPAKIRRLPDTGGMKNQVVALHAHQSPYRQAMRLAGVHFVDVGDSRQTHLREVEAAISGQTTAIFYLAEAENISGSLPLEAVTAVANAHGVPTIVNAAAELPPASNLRRFTDAGAALTIFSGGKDIRGPQNTGLIVGQRDLVRACRLNANPNHSTGRPMKVSKEAIVGLVRAVELYVERDFGQLMAHWEDKVDYLVRALSAIPGICASRGFPTEPGIQPACIPRVYVDLQGAMPPRSKPAVMAELKAGDPGVVVGEFAHGIVLNPQLLRDDEVPIVARRVMEVLSA